VAHGILAVEGRIAIERHRYEGNVDVVVELCYRMVVVPANGPVQFVVEGAAADVELIADLAMVGPHVVIVDLPGSRRPDLDELTLVRAVSQRVLDLEAQPSVPLERSGDAPGPHVVAVGKT